MRENCYRCFRAKSVCFCNEINPISTRSNFFILMHPKEARKERVGTGRLAHLALKSSEIMIDQTFNKASKML